MAKIEVLRSTCGERLISGGATVNAKTGQLIHWAPIGDWDMANAFTNVEFCWEEVEIEESEWPQSPPVYEIPEEGHEERLTEQSRKYWENRPIPNRTGRR